MYTFLEIREFENFPFVPFIYFWHNLGNSSTIDVLQPGMSNWPSFLPEFIKFQKFRARPFDMPVYSSIFSLN